MEPGKSLGTIAYEAFSKSPTSAWESAAKAVEKEVMDRLGNGADVIAQAKAWMAIHKKICDEFPGWQSKTTGQCGMDRTVNFIGYLKNKIEELEALLAKKNNPEEKSIRQRILDGEEFTTKWAVEARKLQNEGHEFQLDYGRGEWSSPQRGFNFLSSETKYRIFKKEATREPQLIPWDSGDIQRIRKMWFRHKRTNLFLTVIGASEIGLLFQGYNRTWRELLEDWECSTDLHKWKPCGKAARQ